MYDFQGDYWSEWSYWDSSLDERDRFLGSSYIYARAWNKHLFGRFNGSNIYEMLNTIYKDGAVDIHFEKSTGNIDHGSPNKRKRSYRLTMKIKTGIGLGAGGGIEPFLLIRWKDDNQNFWSNYRYVSLKTLGNTKDIVNIHNLGSYYSRKWQFLMTENVPFVISKVYEEIDIDGF